jgi:hypothetical protein
VSQLAEIHDLLALKTGKFLLSAMDAACDADERAVAGERPLNPAEQDRMLDGFRASAMVLDIVKLEDRRERFDMKPFFPPELVRDLKEGAQLLAKQTYLLEVRREQFVLDFYRQLEERLAKKFEPAKPAANQGGRDVDDADDEDGETQFRFTGDPTPERGYNALKRMDGQILEIQRAVQKKIEEKRQAAAAASPKPAPAASPKPAPTAERAPQDKPQSKPAWEPKDVLWQEPWLCHDLLALWKAAGEWYQSGCTGPPPEPTDEIREALEKDPKGNPESTKILKWLRHKDPPGG